MALPATDTFTAASDIDLVTYSSNWAYVVGSYVVWGSLDSVSSGGTGSRNAARWTADTFPDNQYAQGTTSAVGGQYTGVAVRLSSGAVTFYAYTGNQSESSLDKVVAGTGTAMSLGAAQTAGQTIRIEAEGDTIRGLRNGTLADVGEVTDTSIASGAAGLGGWGYSDLNSQLDNWEAGSLSISVALIQTRFRFRNDDGSETTATWAEDENAAHSAGEETVLRLRLQVDSTGDPAAAQFQLEYCEQGGTNWKAVQ